MSFHDEAPSKIAVYSSTSAAHVDATCHKLGLTADEFRDLHRQCTKAADSAYCPYSNFAVGAAVMTRYGVGGAGTTGTVVQGANVENASYPVGTCAERVALGRAVFEGHRDFKALAVVALGGAEASPPCSPCGMCRQFIREFCGLDMPVLMFSKDGRYIAVRFGELLPLSFGPEALGIAP